MYRSHQATHVLAGYAFSSTSARPFRCVSLQCGRPPIPMANHVVIFATKLSRSEPGRSSSGYPLPSLSTSTSDTPLAMALCPVEEHACSKSFRLSTDPFFVEKVRRRRPLRRLTADRALCRHRRLSRPLRLLAAGNRNPADGLGPTTVIGPVCFFGALQLWQIEYSGDCLQGPRGCFRSRLVGFG
jgi:hypothetical protein